MSHFPYIWQRGPVAPITHLSKFMVTSSLSPYLVQALLSILSLLTSSPTLSSLQLRSFPPAAAPSPYNPAILALLPSSLLLCLSLCFLCPLSPARLPSATDRPGDSQSDDHVLFISFPALDSSSCLWLTSLLDLQ